MKFIIAEPCNADWKSMRKCGNDRFCEECKLLVRDGNKLRDEAIARLLETEKKVCMRLPATKVQTKSLRVKFASAVEGFFEHLNLRRMARLAALSLLFVSCAKRIVYGGIATNACKLESDKINLEKEKKGVRLKAVN